MPLKLLLADDNPINQKVGITVLQRLGYRADVASNGVEVLKALEQRPYDLLFLDVQMPEMDGLDAARQICQRWPAEKRPTIIAMTGNALVGDREKCLAAGMDDYISKPVRKEELQAALERWGPRKSASGDTSTFRRPSPPEEDLLDSRLVSELRETVPSDKTVALKQMIGLYLETAPKHLKEISSCLDNPGMVTFQAHSLKSISQNLGVKRISEIASKLEEVGRSGNLEGAAGLLQDLQTTFTHTRSHLLKLRDS